MNTPSRRAASALFFLLAAGLAHAAPGPANAGAKAQPHPWREPPPPEAPFGSDLAPAPMWAELSPSERFALSPLAKDFDGMDAHQRRKWKALARRAKAWTPEQLATAQSRMSLWARMTPEQRSAARQQALAPPPPRERPGRAESWRRWESMERGPGARAVPEPAHPGPNGLVLPDAGPDPRPK